MRCPGPFISQLQCLGEEEFLAAVSGRRGMSLVIDCGAEGDELLLGFTISAFQWLLNTRCSRFSHTLEQNGRHGFHKYGLTGCERSAERGDKFFLK